MFINLINCFYLIIAYNVSKISIDTRSTEYILMATTTTTATNRAECIEGSEAQKKRDLIKGALSPYIKEVLRLYFKPYNAECMDQKIKQKQGACESVSHPVDGKLYQIVMEEAERELFSAILLLTGNNQSIAAELLNLHRGTFRRKLAYYFK